MLIGEVALNLPRLKGQLEVERELEGGRNERGLCFISCLQLPPPTSAWRTVSTQRLVHPQRLVVNSILSPSHSAVVVAL